MSIGELAKLSDEQYHIKILSLEDESIVQQLCEESYDYFNIVEGRPPLKSAAKEILLDLPDNKTYEDKYVIGVFDEKQDLVAVADIIRDYPLEKEWIIGLFMINPKKRKKGLGTMMHEYIKSIASAENANKLRIGVVQDNYNALRFWKSLGYLEVKRITAKYGYKDHSIIVMNYQL